MAFVAINCAAIFVSTIQPQTRQAESVGGKTIQTRVAEILREIVQTGSGKTPDGVPFWTSRVRPSESHIREMRSFGREGTKALDFHIWNTNDPRESAVAVRILGRLGGPDIVVPLTKIIKQHMSPTLRADALRSMTQAPCNLAAPVMQEAAQHDPDAQVRATAKKMLSSFCIP